MANYFRSILLRLQNKTVTAGTSASTVTNDSGYDGLGAVTVNPTPSETKTQAAGTSNIDVTPTSGKLLSKVTVTPTPSETKSQAAGTSNIDVTPTSGKLLSKVTVTPQQHSGYYPSSSTNITSNGTSDLGATHNYRYVKVNVPSPTLSGDAAVDNVLATKTFYNTSTTKQTGTMTNNGAVSQALNCGGSYTIPKGYHNGSGKVTANSLASQTGVDSGKTAVTAGAMLSGYQGWVNGSKVSGSISSKAAEIFYPSGNDQEIAAGYYLSGKQTFAAVTTTNLSPANIKVGVNVRVGDTAQENRVADVTGSFTRANTVSSGQTAAAAAQIKSGYSAWVNGAEVKGSYVEPTITSITPSNTPVSLTANTNYKPSSAGYAIEVYKEITPSNSNPVPLYGNVYTDATARGIYKIASGKNGCAIESYQSKTPTTSGVAFDAGFVKMANSGYAYSVRPSISLSTATLWTNSNPTASFAANTTISLSSSLDNFDYIRITFRYSTTDDKTRTTIFTPEEIEDFASYHMAIGMTASTGTSNHRDRYFGRTSTTQLKFTTGYAAASTATSTNVIIPTKVEGLKYIFQ